MAIIIRREDNGFAHNIQISDETWIFNDPKVAIDCCELLVAHKISYGVRFDTNSDTREIYISDGWIKIEPKTKDEKDVKENDKLFHCVLTELLNWSIRGTRSAK